MAIIFHCRIRELRLEKKFTQQDIANKIGITRPAYSAYEAGKRQPDFGTLMQLADIFDVTTDYLLGRENYRKQPVKSSFVISSYIDDSITAEQMEDILNYIDFTKHKNAKKDAQE